MKQQDFNTYGCHLSTLIMEGKDFGWMTLWTQKFTTSFGCGLHIVHKALGLIVNPKHWYIILQHRSSNNSCIMGWNVDIQCY